MTTKLLHVAFFNRAYYPETSATAELLTDLAEELTKNHGFKVSVVCGVSTRTGWRLITHENHNEVSLFRARGTRFPKQFFPGRLCNYLSYFSSACLAGLQLDKPDLVVALTDPPIIGLAALVTKKRFGCRLVMAYKDLFPEVARLMENFHSPLLGKCLGQVNAVLIRNADQILALGNDMRDKLINEKQAPAEKTAVIPDYVDTDQITPSAKPNLFSETHGLSDKFVVMHSGNLGLSQNLEAVVEMASLLRDLPDLRVVFVGQGVKKESLQNLVRAKNLSNILFLPYQPREQLIHSFATADCFVVSLKAGVAGYITPSKLYGILAAGRPYIAAIDDYSDAVRIAKEFQCGLPAIPGNAPDMADKVRQLHANRTLCKTMGENARRASFRYDRKAVAKEYADLFRSLSSSQSPCAA